MVCRVVKKSVEEPFLVIHRFVERPLDLAAQPGRIEYDEIRLSFIAKQISRKQLDGR